MKESEARRLGVRWLAAFPGSAGWVSGMKVLVVVDAPEGERDLESGITTEPAGPAFVVAVDADGATIAWPEHPGTADSGLTLRDDVPDLRDPATRGACLGLLRERWNDATLHVWPASSVRWYVRRPSATSDTIHDVLGTDGLWRLGGDPKLTIWGDTEALALVLAAEAHAALRGRP